VTWASSAASIATVSSSGVVTGVTAGTATIAAPARTVGIVNGDGDLSPPGPMPTSACRRRAPP
jgi:hypothetical protein